MPTHITRALVLGGSGLVGGEILRRFSLAQIPTRFTYLRSVERARRLEQEFGQTAIRLDLADEQAVREFAHNEIETPTILAHAAATISDDLATVHAVNVQSAFTITQELAPRMATAGGGNIILMGALDRTQSLPLPVAFATTQGALGAMTMALAKKFGRDNIFVNMIAVGLLGEGLSAQLDPQLVADYRTFSAFRRTGTAAEVAEAVYWLACQNSYMNGRIVPINGGI